LLPRYLKFALKSSVSVAKSAQKKHEMIGWTPQIDCHSLLSTIMQNKKLQIVLCHKRIISSKFKIFKKNHTPKTHCAFNCKHCSSYCWLLKFSLAGPEIFLYQGQKNKRSDVRIINFIWLYPFSWMFSLWLHFFCQVAIFWLKTVQFSSQKCNEFSGRNLIAIFEHKPEKIFKTTQNATLPLYLFCLSKKFSKACFSLSFFLPLIYSYKSWYKNDPKKGEY